jgi:hypothetical protein
LEENLVSLLELVEKQKELEEKYFAVGQLLHSIHIMNETIEVKRHILGADQMMTEIIGTINNIEDTHYQYDRVKSIVTNLKDIEDKLEIEQEWLSIEQSFIDLHASINNYANMSDKWRHVKSSMDSVKKISIEQEQLQKQIGKDTDYYTSELKKYGICPFCGTQFDDQLIERMVTT